MEKKQVFDPYNTRVYKPFAMADATRRPGALAMLSLPSRVGGTLFYPNGEVRRG